MLARAKNLAKKNYFHCKIEEHKNSPKKTWDVLCNLLPNKPVSHVSNSIIVDDKNISDSYIIADKFNIDFANAGKVLAFRLNCCECFSFISQIALPIFCLSLSHITTRNHQISKLPKIKQSGYDDILLFILKTIIQVFALSLSIMISYCIAFGTFPHQLKLAKDIPVYKSKLSVDMQVFGFN